jgi:hypothetical protein
MSLVTSGLEQLYELSLPPLVHRLASVRDTALHGWQAELPFDGAILSEKARP